MCKFNRTLYNTQLIQFARIPAEFVVRFIRYQYIGWMDGWMDKNFTLARQKDQHCWWGRTESKCTIKN